MNNPGKDLDFLSVVSYKRWDHNARCVYNTILRYAVNEMDNTEDLNCA